MWRRLALVVAAGAAACSSPSPPAVTGFVFPGEGRVVDLDVGADADPSAEEGLGTWLLARTAPASGRCVAPLVVIDHTEPVLQDPGAVLGLSALQSWERQHGPVPYGAILAVRSGWSARRDRPELYAGESNGHPGVSRAVLETLVLDRELAGVLVETPALTSEGSEALDWLLEKGRYAVVGVRALDGLPATGCLCIVAPFPGPGGRLPARIYAIAPRTVRTHSPW